MTVDDAKKIAHGLIQGYIGPDHRVMDMPSFYGALIQALQGAYVQGWRTIRSREADESLTWWVGGNPRSQGW